LLKIHVFDTRHLGRANIIAVTALEADRGLVLFDVGPESAFQRIINELRKVGFEPSDVRHVFLSHIHFDHAGAAWRFAELGATVYVHPRGLPHLIDPAKLIASAQRIFGDDLEKLWGRVAAVPADRVRGLEDGEIIQLPPFEIRAIATPGHASHHHVYHWDDHVFGGDIAGVRIGRGPPIPPFVPPELHIESWHDSIAKIRALNAAQLYLPHFGKIEGKISDHLAALDERVSRWSEWLRNKIRAGVNEDELCSAFATYEHDDLRSEPGVSNIEALITDYETADPSHMAVSGALRYWRKYHPEQIASGPPGQG
jgi:glyoxylase-like metal-dependent hydrolase (beta-lactamase superfamily II)